MTFINIESIISVIQSVTTIMAIIIGGIWSYILFVGRRQKYPRAKVEHHIVCRPVVEGKLLLSIDITITNQSDVLLVLISSEINARKLLPPNAGLLRLLSLENMGDFSTAPQIIEWDLIASRKDNWKKGELEIEPGEQHQIHSDFLINSKVSSILIESYFQNVKKRGKQIGWKLTTIHDLKNCLIGD